MPKVTRPLEYVCLFPMPPVKEHDDLYSFMVVDVFPSTQNRVADFKTAVAPFKGEVIINETMCLNENASGSLLYNKKFIK